MPRPIDALLEFLRAEQARGVASVALDDEAREILRHWHRSMRAAGGPAAGKAAAKPRRDPAAGSLRASLRVAEEVAAPAPVAPPVPVPEGASAAEQIASLAAQAQHWAPARSLGSLRDTMVFSTGNPEAELMLVGEAPGYHEERRCEPFVGAAGEQLDKILTAMGIERAAVYISNIVKFRPAMANQSTSNRKPTPEEMVACLPFVRAEVGVVRPRCIVALGATAAEGLLGLTGPVGKMRGRWHEFEGVPVRVTYHPAYLLHGGASIADKRKIWEDMLEVMALLDLPVSDKQRAYFLPKAR